MKRKNRRRKHNHMSAAPESPDIRQYIIAGMILLFGIAASIVILRRPFDRSARDGGAHPDGAETVTEFSAAEMPPTTYTVNFYDTDGIRIDSRRVYNGEAILPPEIALENCVFKGWDNPFYAIEQDMDVYPLFQSLAGKKNVIYADAVYSDAANEFTVTIRLDGDVNCCSFTILAAYDRDLLRLVEAETLAAFLSVDSDEQNGTLRLTCESAEILTQPLELLRLHFSANRQGDYETRIPMQTIEIDTIQDEIRVYTDSIAYDADVYLLDFHKNQIH